LKSLRTSARLTRLNPPAFPAQDALEYFPARMPESILAVSLQAGIATTIFTFQNRRLGVDFGMKKEVSNLFF
jgi:hypothetical protein